MNAALRARDILQISTHGSRTWATGIARPSALPLPGLPNSSRAIVPLPVFVLKNKRALLMNRIRDQHAIVLQQISGRVVERCQRQLISNLRLHITQFGLLNGVLSVENEEDGLC